MPQIHNPIILLDDDQDDHLLFLQACQDLQIANKILNFTSTHDFREYLRNVRAPPFLILCDCNMPLRSGYSALEDIRTDTATKFKGVPFLFWTTSFIESDLRRCYESSAQGLFIKPVEYTSLLRFVEMIVFYWSTSKHPADPAH